MDYRTRRIVSYFLNVLIALIAVILVAIGTGRVIRVVFGSVDNSDPKCALLRTAYYEQIELATAWYDTAAIELKKCWIETNHQQGTRGRN